MKLKLFVSSLVTLGFADDDIKAALDVTESELATHLLQLEGRKQSEESEAKTGGFLIKIKMINPYNPGGVGIQLPGS